MGLGTYFKEKQAAWDAREERSITRMVKFINKSPQDNFTLVTGIYLFVGFGIGATGLLLMPLVDINPFVFVGVFVAVAFSIIVSLNLYLTRRMKKAGV